ncbi:MAG: M23 family metallopeptidase [Spirochaetales bacterium]
MQLREKQVHKVFGLLCIFVLGFLLLMAEKRLPPSYLVSDAQGQPELPVHLARADSSFLDKTFLEPSPKKLGFSNYTVTAGDTISGIAERFNITQDTIISWNQIEKARTLQIGAVLKVPNMSGLMHVVQSGETLETLSKKYEVNLETLQEVNELVSDFLVPGQVLFIPDARLPAVELRRVWGELFRYPLRGWISSPYGFRRDPFTGQRRFHNGIDIGGVEGAPVRAAMEGRVIETGFNEIAGNYILIQHIGGYTTFYAHLSTLGVSRGAYVREGQKIGEVGSTGYSTGSHLHFSIFRYGQPVNPLLLLY